MNINVSLYLITGIMLGIEHVYVDDTHHFVVDILFVRITVEVEKE